MLKSHLCCVFQMGVELEEDVINAMFAEADVDQSGKVLHASSCCAWSDET